VAHFLLEKDRKIKCFLVDPAGSGLYNKVTRGVMYTREEAEGKRLRNPFDTITEGVGINRLTANFAIAIGAGGSGGGSGGLSLDRRSGGSPSLDNGRQLTASYPISDRDAAAACTSVLIRRPESGHSTPEASTSRPLNAPLLSLLSGAFKASDQEAVEMSRYLAREDGLFLGSSSCVNIVGAVKVARTLGPGHRVVTIACDSGVRHLSKFWNPEYVERYGLKPEAVGLEFLARHDA